MSPRAKKSDECQVVKEIACHYQTQDSLRRRRFHHGTLPSIQLGFAGFAPVHDGLREERERRSGGTTAIIQHEQCQVGSKTAWRGCRHRALGLERVVTVERALPHVAHAEGDDATMQPSQRLRSLRILPCQAAQALDPADAARNQPRARQQDNATYRVFSPDALQLRPIVPRRRFRVLTWISLRDAGQCGRVTHALRHVLRQRTDVSTVLRIGSSGHDGMQKPQWIDGTLDCAPV